MFSAHFIPAHGGSRFGLLHPAQGACRGQVLYLHPLMEEMNKSRRMAALQARSLSAAGFDVLLVDLLGCGDSSGDFQDATWAAWLDDAALAVGWLRGRRAGQPVAPLWLWGLRAGALLAADLARQQGDRVGPCNFLFWQPAANGRNLLLQLLRLRTAGQTALAGSSNTGTAPAAAARGPGTEQLRTALLDGEALDIAGYRLAPGLATGLDRAELRPPAPTQPGDGLAPGQVVWLETSMRDNPALGPASQAAAQRWAQAGHSVQAACVPGPAFWQTIEIEDAPELIQATCSRLVAAAAAPAVPGPA